ncbi:hypothetical protein N7476_005079 [Penicillium atrosanguineum]|uniref:Uncharacterized protein n=1 Tax=Penicillium atrosanguineum TaxID=1132637 RepID=A0A9W9Q283_9EURO|nr:hypothetical protein N7526_002019 [Penicillium atrosanguineum]KAJ5318659.1 hypothetical protein N7476_005079 [Penicillium atrosanguineum]
MAVNQLRLLLVSLAVLLLSFLVGHHLSCDLPKFSLNGTGIKPAWVTTRFNGSTSFAREDSTDIVSVSDVESAAAHSTGSSFFLNNDTSKNDIEILRSNGVVALYLVRGGTRSDRHRKARSFDDRFHMLKYVFFRDAEALLLLETFGFNETQLSDGYIRQISEFHNGYMDPWIQVVDLQIQVENFLACSEDDDTLMLSIKDLGIEDSLIRGVTRLNYEAGKAVTALVKQTLSSTLVINWNSKLDSDLTILPELPPEVKVLHIWDCPNIFRNPTTHYPTSDPKNQELTPWFIDFIPNFAGLNRLVLWHSGYTEVNLRDLRGSLPQLEILINGETVD